MLGDLSHVEKIYVRCGLYTDIRKQLNGLLDIISTNFKLDPTAIPYSCSVESRLTGSKRRPYEGDGFYLLYKRYEADVSNDCRLGE